MEPVGAFFVTPQVDWVRYEQDILGIRVTHGAILQNVDNLSIAK
jgi:hypothetical protein